MESYGSYGMNLPGFGHSALLSAENLRIRLQLNYSCNPLAAGLQG